jgi:hypothetical protein
VLSLILLLDIFLISTTDMKDERGEVRARMLRSLVESQRALREQRICLDLLLQNCDSAELASFAAAAPEFVHPVAVAGRVPLSIARNMLLRRLVTERSIGLNALVAFPDDDCWYPAGFLSEVVALFARDSALDFWFCRYASQPTQDSIVAAAPASAHMAEIVRNASSNTIFLRGRVVTAIGEFDEALGIGTPLGGGEDLDYALRAHYVARKTAYRDAAMVGHRDKSPSIRARYYASSLVVLARHAGNGAGGECLRKLAVGAYLIVRRELRVRDFTRALRQALSAHRDARRDRRYRGKSRDVS